MAQYPYLYKMIPAELGVKILTKGLSFSCVNNFVDKDREFSFLAQRITAADIRRYMPAELMREPTHESRALAQRLLLDSSYASLLSELYKSGFGREPEIQATMKDHYYVCSLTSDDNPNFSWSDDTKSPKIQLRFDTQKLLNEFPTWVRHVNYVCEPVKANIFALRKDLSKILNAKNEAFRNEQEVRIILYDQQLSVYARINVGFSEEILPDGRKFYYNRRLPKYLAGIRFCKGCSESVKNEIRSILRNSQNVEQQKALCVEYMMLMKELNYPKTVNGQVFLLANNHEKFLTTRERKLKRLRLVIDELSLYHPYDEVNNIMDLLLAEQMITPEVERMLNKSHYSHVVCEEL